MKKQYNIPIHWESYKTYQVEADNLQEAVTEALQQFLKEPDENYIDDSFTIDDILSNDYQDEDYNFHEALQNISV